MINVCTLMFILDICTEYTEYLENDKMQLQFYWPSMFTHTRNVFLTVSVSLV